MNSTAKKKLIEKAEQLYAEQKYDEIIDLLMPLDVRDDYDLALIMIRAFLDVSETRNDELLDSAEMLLMLFPNASDDPRWLYQLARAYFFRGRYIEACRELVRAQELAAEGKPFPERADAQELLETAKNESEKITSAVYSPEELSAVYRHITAWYGKIAGRVIPASDEGIEIEIADIPPDPEDGRDHRIYVTVGAGAHKMNVPPPYNEMVGDRAEFVMYLPSDADEDMLNWAAGYLSVIARLPVERDSWCSYGHIFSNGRPLMPGTELCACTLIEVQDLGEEASVCELPDGSKLTFYQVFPLYKEELVFKMSHGLSDLIRKMPHISAVLDLTRENVCKGEEENGENSRSGHGSPLLAEETDYVSGLGIGEFCAASRLITEKGFRVAYMRRFLNDRNDGAEIPGDTGWLFMSGRETGEFLTDPSNIEVCRLNMICNIDADILPFLKEPYNTIVVRGKDGRLRIEPGDPPLEPLS